MCAYAKSTASTKTDAVKGAGGKVRAVLNPRKDKVRNFNELGIWWFPIISLNHVIGLHSLQPYSSMYIVWMDTINLSSSLRVLIAKLLPNVS